MGSRMPGFVAEVFYSAQYYQGVVYSITDFFIGKVIISMEYIIRNFFSRCLFNIKVPYKRDSVYYNNVILHLSNYIFILPIYNCSQSSDLSI